MPKHFLNLRSLKKTELEEILKLAQKFENKRKGSLKGRTLVLLFEKRSTRTRLSFEIAMRDLNGDAIFLGREDIHLGINESIEDTLRAIACYCHGIAARVYKHEMLEKMKSLDLIPIINALSDLSHPCQALSDIYTIKKIFGKLKGLKLTFLGDGNNVCNSLIEASAIFGMNMTVSSPKGYDPNEEFVKYAELVGKRTGGTFEINRNPREAVREADIIYTDTWVSMGMEREKEKRLKAFKNYQLNPKLLENAKRNYIIMHCLPAHRGFEIANKVIDGKNSVVWKQAENRLHVQKALLYKLLK